MNIRPKLAFVKRKFTYSILKAMLTPIRFLPKKRVGIFVDLLIQNLAEILANSQRSFIRYSVTPYSANHSTLSKKRFLNTAIVISGVFETEYEFTLRTLELLRERYPEVILIFSGWKDSEDFADEMHKLDVYHLINEEPEGEDLFNLQHQSIAVSEGLKIASSLGAEFALRLRSDQRIINPNAIEYLHSLHKSFPISDNVSKLKGRIIGISDCLSLFAKGHFPDHFHFGLISDLLKYWIVPSDIRQVIPNDLHRMSSFLDYETYTEQILGSNFLRAIGIEVDQNYLSHWEVVSKYWIIIERQDIDLFWKKYRWWDQERGDHFDRHLNFPYSKKIHTTSNIHKEQWMAMQLKDFESKAIDIQEIRGKNTSDILF